MSALAVAPVSTPAATAPPAAAPPKNGAEAPPASTAPPGEKAEPEPDEPEEYEIDGKKVLLNRTQRKTLLQKSGAADKRLQEATESQKKAAALVAEFERDPEAAMRKAGKDPDAILAALLERKAKQALLTPEQLALAKAQEERDQAKAEAKKLADEKKAAADAELDQHNQEALETQLISAADKFGLDGTPETLEALCDIAIELLDYGLNPSAEQIAEEYLRREQELIEQRERKMLPKLKGPRLVAYLKANIGALVKLPPAELLEVLGPDGVKAFQTATLTRLPSSAATPKPATVPAPPRQRDGQGRYTTEAEFVKKYPR